MVYVRIKKIKGNEYAYLVENKWNKKLKQPKQKVKSYLGRFYNFDIKDNKDFVDHHKINMEKYFKENSINKVIKDLIEFEFLKHDISEFEVNLDKKSILKNKNRVVLGINGGYLCNHTLRKLTDFRFNEEEELGYGLAKAFSEAGINVSKEVFVEVFNKMVGGK